MKPDNPHFFRRIGIAIASFFKIIGNSEFAGGVQALRLAERQDKAAKAAVAAAKPAAPALKEAAPDGALQLLGLLQREARFIDFIQEDVAAYPDADVGAAARLVHEGCRKVLSDNFSIDPVREEEEGSAITLPEGFDAAAVRITGNVVGEPPFNGHLTHRGWRVVETRLPKLSGSHDLHIVAPAEVEL